MYDIFATPMELNADGNVVVQGERVLDVTVDGIKIVEDGSVVPGDALDLAVVDFLANGGDEIFANYLSQDYPFTRIGLSDQNALQSYVEGLAGGDATFDLISDARYDNVADGRIAVVPEPSTWLMAVMLGLAAASTLRRRPRRVLG